MEFIYQILPLAVLVLIVFGVVKLFSKKKIETSQFGFYNYKTLIIAIVIGIISSLDSLQAGIYAIIISFIISFVLWYLIITFVFWVVHKFR